MRKSLFYFVSFTITIGICFLIVWMADIYKGYTYYKDQHSLITNQRYVRLREPQKLSVSKNVYDLKIAFFGGSTTACTKLDFEDRFPNVFRKALKDSLNIDTEILNASNDGNHSMHSLNILLNTVVEHRPDYAIWMHNINDLSTLLHEKTYWNRNVSRSLIVDSFIFNYWIPDHSDKPFPNLWTVYDLVNNNYPKKEFGNSDSIIVSVLYPEISKEYVASVRSFVRVSRSFNISPILLTQLRPHMNSLKKGFEEAHQSFNDSIRLIAIQEDVLCLDIDSVFQSNNKAMFYDRMHFNKNGSRLVGDFLFQELKTTFEK